MKNSKYELKLELIGPEKAKAALARQPRNRKVNQKRVEKYKHDIETDNWSPASMVIFDEDGNLVDGQHRLLAIVAAGKAAWLVVFYGLEKRFIPHIDTGRVRTAGDMLAFLEGADGMTSLANKSTMIRIVCKLHYEDFDRLIGHDEIADELLGNVEKTEKAYDCYRKLKGCGGTLAVGAAVFLILESPNDDMRLAEFVEQVAYGENIHVGMPAYAARNALHQNSIRKDGMGRQKRDVYYFLSAWRDFVNGSDRKLYRAPKEIDQKTLRSILPEWA